MRQHIPNSITLLNLIFGCCAVAAIFYHQYSLAFWLVLAGVAADYADGFVARLLGVSSELGKELDSLADMVTFGVVPGAIYYSLLVLALNGNQGTVSYLGVIGFLVTAFSCLRLAKFNLDTRQTDSFIGLPTPSSTMFTLGLMMIYEKNIFDWGVYILQPVLLISCVIILSYLLVAEIPMFSLKFKSFSWKGNEIKFIFAFIAMLLLIIAREAAFSIVILMYVLFSIVSHLSTRELTT
jgi:CDP-diacylglycerol--serine O-phosphatidyltransferase